MALKSGKDCACFKFTPNQALGTRQSKQKETMDFLMDFGIGYA